MAGDVIIKVVKFTGKASVASTTDITADLNGKTPKAVIIFGGAALDTDTPETPDARQCMGFAVNGGNQNYHAATSRDAVTFTDVYSRWRNDRVIRAGDAVTFTSGQVTSWFADGVRITWDPGSVAGRRYIAVLIAGDDVSAVTDVIFPSGSDPVVDVTTVGFEPDLVIVKSNIMNAASNVNVNQYGFCFGAATPDGENHCVGMFEPDAILSGGLPSQAVYNNACHFWLNSLTGVVAWTAEINDFDADGFSFDVTGGVGGDAIAYLALKFDGVSVNIFDSALETSTGETSYTNPGFFPQFVISAFGSVTTANTSVFDAAPASAFGIGFSDNSTQYAHAIRIDDSADPTDCGEFTRSATALMVGEDIDVDATIAELTSMDLNGFTLNYTSVSAVAQLGFFISIQAAAVAVSADVGTVSVVPPEAVAAEGYIVTGGVGTVTVTPIEGTASVYPYGRVTMAGMGLLGRATSDVRVTTAGLEILGKHRSELRVTNMGLLLLARGALGNIVPDPLSLSDQGRSMVIRQRLVNMYTEPTPQGPSESARFGRPGLETISTIGSGPIRATFLWRKEQARITVSGAEVYYNNVLLGEIPNTDGLPVRWAISDDECVIVTNGKAYYVTVYGITEIVNANFVNLIDVKFLSGRFIYVIGDGSGRYFYSDLGDAQTVNGLSFASAESSPDPLRACERIGDAMVFFGTKTVEFHFATSNIDAPYQRSQGRRYDKGTQSPHSIVLVDNTLVFLGSDKKIYRAEGIPIAISNDDVADRCRKVTDENLSSVTAFTVTFGNHEWYVINLPEQGTWAYDFVQRTWAEWKTWTHDRFRVNVADANFMGDIYSGKLLGFDGQVFTDVGDPLERICSTFAPLREGSVRNFNLALMCKRGVGLPSGYGSDPVVEMRFSDHQDSRWSNWREAPLGKVGVKDRKAMAIWIGLGAMTPPGRQYEFRCSDPVEFIPYEVKQNVTRP